MFPLALLRTDRYFFWRRIAQFKSFLLLAINVSNRCFFPFGFYCSFAKICLINYAKLIRILLIFFHIFLPCLIDFVKPKATIPPLWFLSSLMSLMLHFFRFALSFLRFARIAAIWIKVWLWHLTFILLNNFWRILKIFTWLPRLLIWSIILPSHEKFQLIVRNIDYLPIESHLIIKTKTVVLLVLFFQSML